MKPENIKFLACPNCYGELQLNETETVANGKIKSGEIFCSNCQINYPIINFIPRFVPTENYANNFSLEWKLHSKTQYDSYSGIKESERRFFAETKWGRSLSGETILEVGSGSGRFTEQAASTGAFVVSMDYSNAVEANYQSNGEKDNVFIVQADIYAMPFKKNYFDKLLCIGVLQHTPDPEKAFKALPPFLKDGGNLVIDVYRKWWGDWTMIKNYIRPITKRMNPEKLYKWVCKYVDVLWPLMNTFNKIPKIGKNINWTLGLADNSQLGLKGQMLKEWTYLDTFDMLSPRYELNQTLKTVKRWFCEAGMSDIDIHYGYNGIEGRGFITKIQVNN